MADATVKMLDGKFGHQPVWWARQCAMRRTTHFIVPSKRFELLGDSQKFLTIFTFGTRTAKHTFCKVCGITSFYTPKSNLDVRAITYKCVDPGTLTHVEIKHLRFELGGMTQVNRHFLCSKR